MLNALYEGDFDNVGEERDSILIKALARGYVAGFSRQCYANVPSGSPPPGTEELTEDHCDESVKTVNGYGVTVAERCEQSHVVKTGEFADRELWAAQTANPANTFGEFFKQGFESIKNGAYGQLTAGMTRLAVVGSKLTQINGCTSPALRRFKENLTRFMLGQQGLGLDGRTLPIVLKQKLVFEGDIGLVPYFKIKSDLAKRSLLPADAQKFDQISGAMMRIDQDPNGTQEQFVEQRDALLAMSGHYYRECAQGDRRACAGSQFIESLTARLGELYQHASEKHFIRDRQQRGGRTSRFR